MTKKQSDSVLHWRVHNSVLEEGQTVLFQCEMQADCFFNFVCNCASWIQYTETNFAHFNTDILCPKDDTQHKEPEKWCTGEWLLHCDYTYVHSALSLQKFLANNDKTVPLHPLYSSDQAPFDFFLLTERQIGIAR
jgi:hypothetical protein